MTLAQWLDSLMGLAEVVAVALGQPELAAGAALLAPLLAKEIANVSAALQQSGEWTDQEYADFTAKTEALFASPAWQVTP